MQPPYNYKLVFDKAYQNSRELSFDLESCRDPENVWLLEQNKKILA